MVDKTFNACAAVVMVAMSVWLVVVVGMAIQDCIGYDVPALKSTIEWHNVA